MPGSTWLCPVLPGYARFYLVVPGCDSARFCPLVPNFGWYTTGGSRASYEDRRGGAGKDGKRKMFAKSPRSFHHWVSPLLRFLQICPQPWDPGMVDCSVCALAVMLTAKVAGISYSSFHAFRYLIADSFISTFWTLLLLPLLLVQQLLLLSTHPCPSLPSPLSLPFFPLQLFAARHRRLLGSAAAPGGGVGSAAADSTAAPFSPVYVLPFPLTPAVRSGFSSLLLLLIDLGLLAAGMTSHSAIFKTLRLLGAATAAAEAAVAAVSDRPCTAGSRHDVPLSHAVAAAAALAAVAAAD
ncbi:unnamed protein product [Closterium sp. NIES-53]